MRTVISAVWLLAVAIALPSTAGAQESKDVAAIRANSAAFAAAYNKGEVDAVLKHFADTAVVMPPNMPALRSRDEIRQFVETGMARAKASGLTLTLAAGGDVGTSGDLAFHSGAYSASSGGAVVDTGKYLETWRKSGGQWRMIRRIWNSDRAPAAK